MPDKCPKCGGRGWLHDGLGGRTATCNQCDGDGLSEMCRQLAQAKAAEPRELAEGWERYWLEGYNSVGKRGGFAAIRKIGENMCGTEWYPEPAAPDYCYKPRR